LSLLKLVGSTVLGLVALALVISGCGDSGSDEPTVLRIGVSEKGKTASFSVPKSTTGGLVEVKLTNEGKAPHGVQFVRYEDGHTAAEALELLEGESEKTPDWLRAEGGIGGVGGGESATATLNLEEGNFLISDAASFGEKPATAELTVEGGSSGDLPDTEATVTAEETGEDKYAWDVANLTAGPTQITFDSEGDEAIHLIIAAPLKGKVPPLSQIKKEFGEEKEGPPPPYLDFEAAQSTAVLDGGKSQTAPLDLKPGRYLFFCPLTDRDGGKSHDQEGLLSIETVE
jgi:hypothetical protein